MVALIGNTPFLVGFDDKSIYVFETQVKPCGKIKIQKLLTNTRYSARIAGMENLKFNSVKLKIARQNAGLSISDAARMLRVPYRMIWRWEKGGNIPNAEYFAQLCVLYKERVDFFLE